VRVTTAHLDSRGSNTGFNAEQSSIGAPLKRGTMELHTAFVAHHNKATTATLIHNESTAMVAVCFTETPNCGRAPPRF
jgi:hypothetical protein